MTEHRSFDTTPMPVKLRIADFDLLDRAGAFADYSKTELLDGTIYFINSQHRPHARVKMGLYDALRDGLRAIGSPLGLLVEVTVASSDFDAPEPDIVVTSEPDGEGFVPVASVKLIVEVSDTTLVYDLGRKATLYARSGVAEYWVADVNARVIHQMWAPVGEAYTERRMASFSEQLATASIASLIVDTGRH